jgi:hypothetical protein
MHLRLQLGSVEPSHVRVGDVDDYGWTHVRLGDDVVWLDTPKQVRSVLAEIDRQLPTRADADGVLARFDGWQAKGLGFVDSLRLAAGVGQ